MFPEGERFPARGDTHVTLRKHLDCGVRFQDLGQNGRIADIEFFQEILDECELAEASIDYIYYGRKLWYVVLRRQFRFDGVNPVKHPGMMC